MSAPTLLAVTGRATGLRWSLEKERTILGRSSSCDIQLLDDHAVSRQHAVIERSATGAVLRDLGSQNGCTVNGIRVEGEVLLVPGAVIGIGATTFVFEPALDYLVSATGADVIIAEEVPGATDEVAVSGREKSGAREEAADLLLEIVARGLGSALDGQSDVLQSALAIVAERFRADRAFLLRAPDDGTRPKVLASFGEGPITVSRTVVERVLGGRRAIVSGDAAQDVAFRGGVSLLAGEIRSLLAAPLLVDGRAVGMVHLDRRSRHAYAAGDLEAFVPVVNVLALVAVAAEGIEKLRKRARRSHRIERPEVIAESAAMKTIVDDTLRAARAPSSVLLTGETGTGKEVLARLLHAESDRRAGPFVAVNCGALPANLQESELFGHEKGAFTGADKEKLGLFEAANGGTLFLDEIGECSPETQVKLLRALQERAIFRLGSTRAIDVDVRIVAATSRRLEEMIAKGEMRDDLYYRLAVIHLRVPPLRDRLDDVRALALAFVRDTCREAGIAPKKISEDAVAALARQEWPGNVRELRNTVERLVIMSEGAEIDLGDLPADLIAGSDAARRAIRAGDTLAEAVARVEREMILRAMARTGGVKSAVADALGISRVTLDKKLEVHGIEWEKGKRG